MDVYALVKPNNEYVSGEGVAHGESSHDHSFSLNHLPEDEVPVFQEVGRYGPYARMDKTYAGIAEGVEAFAGRGASVVGKEETVRQTQKTDITPVGALLLCASVSRAPETEAPTPRNRTSSDRTSSDRTSSQDSFP